MEDFCELETDLLINVDCLNGAHIYEIIEAFPFNFIM